MNLDTDTLITAIACGIASGLGQWIGSSIFPLLGALIRTCIAA